MCVKELHTETLKYTHYLHHLLTSLAYQCFPLQTHIRKRISQDYLSVIMMLASAHIADLFVLTSPQSLVLLWVVELLAGWL